VPAAARRVGGHPAKRTFQALRIEVNGELEVLGRAIPAAVDALAVGGRIVVLAYHSLEDRMVKLFMRDASATCVCSPEIPVCVCGRTPQIRMLTRRAVGPRDQEIAHNPRSRSAHLRAAEKVQSDAA
jgi:16S rRNA (cytosine1402-N4)-methyltransferase